MFNIRSIILLFVSWVLIPRLTFLPKSLHTLLTIFGPFLLPKIIDAFNTSRATSRSVPIRPTPPWVQRALNLLFLSAVVFLVLSLPNFAPENVFLKTQSRLQIQPETLFNRLQKVRDLTADDETLRSKFGSASSKLVYVAYGPDTLINCIWCAAPDGNDAQNYFLYSLPKILTPHIFHLIVLGLATSSMVGTEGSRLRIHATIAGLVLACAEAWYMGTYDVSVNKRATVLQDIDFAHWRIRVWRYLAFAATDAVLGLVLWATSTNRWLAIPPKIAERLEASTKQAEATRLKLQGLGLLGNSINRDSALRGVREEYWQTEGQWMAETVQEEAVRTQINQALEKINYQGLETHVSGVADNLINSIDGLTTSQMLPSSDTSEAATQ
ncbi:hypothetical protein EJ04DRAFT_511090 [Polyplosphaeria fusca]|uniref:Chorismate synthase protein n=1 Tax=Polyplosphaeria fusca TaxID=682080 RepID=A0A9P4R1J9_9PLEO|nr:hypothetical protein EJ04DRAFT_511090 [Polyplosphaeria fusca]